MCPKLKALIKEDNTNLLERMATMPLGQKPTSKRKKMVLIGPSYTYKGPYYLDRQSQTLLLIAFRSEALAKIWHDPTILPPTFLQVNQNEVYIQRQSLATRPRTEWKTFTAETAYYRIPQLTVVERESLGISQVNYAFDRIEPHFIPIMHHLFGRYVIDPIIGDTHLFNILINSKGIVAGIDIEEQRRSAIDTSSIITLLFTGKPAKKKHPKFYHLTRVHQKELLQLITQMSHSIPLVSQLSQEYGIACSQSAMEERAEILKDVISKV